MRKGRTIAIALPCVGAVSLGRGKRSRLERKNDVGGGNIKAEVIGTLEDKRLLRRGNASGDLPTLDGGRRLIQRGRHRSDATESIEQVAGKEHVRSCTKKVYDVQR